MAGPFGRDNVCAVVAAPDARGMMRQLRKALRFTRTVELRLDWLRSDLERTRFLGNIWLNRPRATLIATCRRRLAGGRFVKHPARAAVWLFTANRFGCAWCDMELESVTGAPRDILDKLTGTCRRMLSYHNFHGTPKRRDLARLIALLEVARERIGFDAIKVALYCHSIADSLRVLELARVRRNVVAVPMGEAGLPARILALRHGSALAFAPVEEATAPGQVSLKEMKLLYRADKLNRQTRVYGVIGDPIEHSLSPVMQNAAFQARRVNAVYLPFLVRELRDFLGAIKPLGIRGFSVTLPHKEKILRHLDGCDPLAAAIGAVNTVVVRGSGKLYGYNTDYVGVLRALQRKIPLRGSHVLIFGAGGAARAVAFALAQGGARVSICARRKERVGSLARATGGEAIERRRLRRECFDAIVNATPVGMHPHESRSPLVAAELNCRLVFDLIYHPLETKLLKLARHRGIETVSGLEMFVAQGTAQWEIWMGERAPEAAMRRAVLEALRRERHRRSRSKQ